MIDTTRDFATHVAAHAGLPSERCEHVATIVLRRLGSYLGRPQRQVVADELPPALALAFLEGGGLALPLDELVAGPDGTLGQAHELIASVARVLAEVLSNEALDALQNAVPAELAAMLDRPARELIHEPVAPWRRDTLATGRPGSHQPIAETAPPRTQSNAVAADDPHAATKLSAAHGTTQERRGETLATGNPDPKHPLSGSGR